MTVQIQLQNEIIACNTYSFKISPMIWIFLVTFGTSLQLLWTTAWLFSLRFKLGWIRNLPRNVSLICHILSLARVANILGQGCHYWLKLLCDGGLKIVFHGGLVGQKPLIDHNSNFWVFIFKVPFSFIFFLCSHSKICLTLCVMHVWCVIMSRG